MINQRKAERLPSEQHIAGNEAITAIRFPFRLFTVACLLTTVAFAWFGWIIFDTRRNATRFTGRLSRIEQLRGVIVHLDEVLTMSARMAAATGDSRWEERYHHFEPHLDAAIKEAIKFGVSSSNIKAATETDAANIKLVEMENRAFALVRAGRKEEARTVLLSPEYETQKKFCVEGITSLVKQIRREFQESLRDHQRIDLLSLIAAMVVGGTSFVAWLSAARGVRRWRAELLDNFHRRGEAEESLRKAHAELEVRVNQRTAELANANQALQAENTGRKEAEEAAQGSQKRLRDLIDGLGPSMFVALLTPQGILLEINQSPLAAAGLKPEDVLGKPFDETPWWAHSPEVQRQLREAITRAAHGEASRYDVRTRGAGNQVIDIDFSLQPLRDETGEVVFLIPSASVITERKCAEEALCEANNSLERRVYERTAELETALHAKDEFLSCASHELRTPMNHVLGFAQLLELDELTGDQRDSVGHILTSGRSLLQLIDRILGVSKSDPGDLSFLETSKNEPRSARQPVI